MSKTERQKCCKYKLVIVSVTYKSNVIELKKFIDSFFRFNDLGNEAKLIIVDNSPADYREVELLIDQYKNVSYIFSPENPGFGAANNKGFDLYESEYVLFINNDVEFIEPLFQELIKIHESDERIGCIGIHQMGGAPSYFRKMTAPSNINDNVFNDQYHFISGSFMFFKSSAFVKSGKFDSNIFMYLEEFDISNRLLINKFYTLYCPQFSFLHKVGNRKEMKVFNWETGVISFCYICKKYNLDPQICSVGITRRLLLLILYHLLFFRLKEALKTWHIYKFRKKFIYKEFGVKI